MFGDFALTRWVYGERAKQTQASVPLDARWQLPASTYSSLLQEWTQALAVEFSLFAQVGDVLSRLLGLPVGVSALERMNRAMAETAERDWTETAAAPAEAGDFLVISADGKGVPMRKPATTPPIAAHDGHRGPPQDRQKMAIVGTVYAAKAEVRTPDQVVNARFRDPLEQTPRQKPDAHQAPMAKAVRASLTHTGADGREVNARDVIFPWLREQVRQRDPTGQKPVVVVRDGQTCLWPDAQAALGERSRVEILDLLHVTEKLWDLVHIFDEPARQRFAMESDVALLLEGHVVELIVLFRHWAETRSLPGAGRKTVETVCGDFAANRERMRYDEYLAVGYPIASGVIEGACRHVVKDRLERTGMHWTVSGAQAMLKLRCIAINGQWDEFTEYRLRKKSERLYPHKTLYEVEDWPLQSAA